MRKIFNYILTCSVILSIVSCESESDDFGSQFFKKATSQEISYDLVAYNKTNHDTLNVNAYAQDKVLLGAFSEDHFGLQKTSFVSQLSPLEYKPNFGTNAKVDSVVLEILPEFSSDAVKTSVNESFSYKGQEAKKEIKVYTVAKYGKKSSNMKINVDEISKDLTATDSKINSGTLISLGTRLGSLSFDGTTKSIVILKKGTNEQFYSQDAKVRIPLNKNYFQTKVINQVKNSSLDSFENFLSLFKGINISVEDNDGYFFGFLPKNVSIKMYYSNDENLSSGKNSVYQFNVTTNCIHFNKNTFNRGQEFKKVFSHINKVDGDSHLYLQGMGGPSGVVKIPESVISQIKKVYQEKKGVILSAKIRVYADENWNIEYKKPTDFLLNYLENYNFTSDVLAFLGKIKENLVSGYDLDKNSAYYDIIVTETLRDVIEKSKDNRDLEINVGSYMNIQGNTFVAGQTTRAYTPERIILLGSNTSDTKKIKLNIIYTKK